MTNKTFKLLNELLNHLLTAKAPAVKLLQQGLTRNEIDFSIDELDVQLPEEVYTLYEWRNGISWTDQFSLGEMWIFRGGLFVSLERSIECYTYFLRNGNDWWNESMFMLFESGGGGMYFIDCDQNSPTYRMIIFIDRGATEHGMTITAYDSLDDMLETIIECYREKAFWFESVTDSVANHSLRILHFDFEKESLISREMNPKSDFWNLFAE